VSFFIVALVVVAYLLTYLHRPARRRRSAAPGDLGLAGATGTAGVPRPEVEVGG
jgi:hypothetical protein